MYIIVKNEKDYRLLEQEQPHILHWVTPFCQTQGQPLSICHTQTHTVLTKCSLPHHFILTLQREGWYHSPFQFRMFFFHSYHSSENTWPWSTLSPIVFHQAYYIYHVDFTQLDNKKTQNFWMDTKSYFLQYWFQRQWKTHQKITERNTRLPCYTNF